MKCEVAQVRAQFYEDQVKSVSAEKEDAMRRLFAMTSENSAVLKSWHECGMRSWLGGTHQNARSFLILNLVLKTKKMKSHQINDEF